MDTTNTTELKKKSNTSVILLVLALVAIVIFVINSSGLKTEDSLKMEKETIGQEVVTQEIETSDEIVSSKGSYEAYSQEKVSWAKDGKVILFFKASWCPSCKAADSDIKTNLSSIPDRTYILTVDYDNSTELKKKYGVTYQHTFVQVDENGNQITKWSGSSTLSDIVSNIK